MWRATLLAALLSAAASQTDDDFGAAAVDEGDLSDGRGSKKLRFPDKAKKGRAAHRGYAVPTECTSWFDGCNHCGVENGVVTMCTMMACFEQGKPSCKKCTDNFELKDGKCLAKPALRGKATEDEAVEASSYYYNPYYYQVKADQAPAPAPSVPKRPKPSEWCATSKPQMCKMLCSKQRSCGEGECAMRKGRCCDYTCEASRGVNVTTFRTVTTTAKPKAAEKCTGCCPPMASCFAPDPPCCAKRKDSPSDLLNKEKLQQQMLEASRQRREAMKNSGVDSKRRQGIQTSNCLAHDAKWQPDKFNQMLCGTCTTCAPCYGQKLVEQENDDDEGSKPATKTVRRKTKEEMAAEKTVDEKCGCLETNKAPADTCTGKNAMCQKCAPFCNRCFGVSRTAFSDAAGKKKRGWGWDRNKPGKKGKKWSWGKKQADKINEVHYENTPDGTAAIITS